MYFTKCAQEAMDCGFKCPKCDSDISKYMLLRKVIVGLSDYALRREVFGRCETFSDIDSLRGFCASFEAAQRDATTSVKSAWESSAVAGIDVTDNITGNEADFSQPIAAVSRQRTQHGESPHPTTPSHKPCRNCGGIHAPEKAACPVRNLSWRGCGKRGHIKKMCRLTKNNEVEKVINSVTVGATTVSSEPVLQVEVAQQVSGVSKLMVVVADTGAQVCVAGPALMSSLGLRPVLLQRRAGIRDVAGAPLSTMGALPCRISYCGHSTVQEVHFVKSVERLYLSLDTCKALGLVHNHFPHPLPQVANVMVLDDDDGCLPTRPTAMPLLPLEENIPCLEQWLLRHFSVMQGAPHHIHLKEGAKPYACHTPASVPNHWEVEMKKQLDDDIRNGVICPVPAGVATVVCAYGGGGQKVGQAAKDSRLSKTECLLPAGDPPHANTIRHDV